MIKIISCCIALFLFFLFTHQAKALDIKEVKTLKMCNLVIRDKTEIIPCSYLMIIKSKIENKSCSKCDIDNRRTYYGKF